MTGTTGDKFWSRVAKGEAWECWTWLGSIHAGSGYGIFHPGTGKRVRAHRVAYELERGPIPDGLYLDHLCRNRECVNPSHLEAVTNKENVLRGIGLSAINARKTRCKRGHEFTPENTRLDKRGRRNCRTCERARHKQDRAEKRYSETGRDRSYICPVCGERRTTHLSRHLKAAHGIDRTVTTGEWTEVGE